MQWTTIVNYRVLINDEPKQSFVHIGGLRQEDPLSLYNFMLYVNMPSTMIYKVDKEILIQRIRARSDAPTISHLFYDDELILFFKAFNEACDQVNSIFSNFE